MRNAAAAEEAPLSDLLTVSQAADELNVHRRTIQHWIANGKVTAIRIGTGRTSAYVLTRDEVARIRATSRGSREIYAP